ncbi:MAG: hypothetical protein LC776_14400 [Acidobacteria bacterium]|nr:hypothetical protein [Acidobacteriota bacterium]
MSILPIAATAQAATTSCTLVGCCGGRNRRRWFFLCLDDLTPEVGATCLVPGSRRIGSKHEPPLGHAWTGNSLEDYPLAGSTLCQAGATPRRKCAAYSMSVFVKLRWRADESLEDRWSRHPAARESTMRCMLGADRQP